MNENKKIEIKLDLLEKKSPLPENELIYQQSFSELKEEIWSKAKANVNALQKGACGESRDSWDLQHQPCFFINGGRGSGKSTLLRVLRNDLCNRDNQKVKMQLLADIDPTELADTENFFIHILGRVQRLLLEQRQKASVSGWVIERQKKAYQCIHTMSRGLGLLVRRPEMLEGIGDVEGFVQESVEECASGTKLKEEFAKLVNELCALLGVEALLVTVDDADMNFNKCSEVFETVRKYLLNPRMVFVFAGDLQLYTMVVRGMQMRHFGQMTLQHDGTRRKHRLRLLDNLEDQYIMKLFPAGNRITLTNFSGVLERQICISYLNFAGNREERLLNEYLKHELKEYVPTQDFEIQRRFIGNLSIRSALQLIAYWTRHLRPIEGDEENQRKIVEQNLKHWSNGIRIVTSHALIKHEIDSFALSGKDSLSLIRFVLKHVNGLNLGIQGARMLPEYGEDSQQAVSFYLSAEIIKQIRTIPRFLSFVMNVFPYLQHHEHDGQPQGEKSASLERLRQILWHLRSSSRRQRGADCTSVMLPFSEDLDAEEKLYGNGVIPLLSESREVKGSSEKRLAVEDAVERMMAGLEQDKTSAKLRFILSFNHAISFVEREDEYCLSIYNLLTLMERLLSLRDSDTLESQVRELLDLNRYIPTANCNSSAEELRRADKGIRNMGSLNAYFIRLGDEVKSGEVMRDVISEVVAWVRTYDNVRISTSMPELYGFWAYLMRECGNVTAYTAVRALRKDKLAAAGTLFAQYLTAVRDALSQKVDKRLSMVISECPLWKCWNEKDKVGSLWDDCNRINIGCVELTFDLVRFEEHCKLRIDRALDRQLRQMRENVNDVVQNHIMELESWWEQRVATAKQDAAARLRDAGVAPDVLAKTLAASDRSWKDALSRRTLNLWKAMDEEKSNVVKEAENWVERYKSVHMALIMRNVEELTSQRDALALLDVKLESLRLGLMKNCVHDLDRLDEKAREYVDDAKKQLSSYLVLRKRKMFTDMLNGSGDE